MANIKVLKSFNDIHTHLNHPVGEVFEVTEERINEIRKVDPELIEVMKDTKKKVGEQ